MTRPIGGQSTRSQLTQLNSFEAQRYVSDDKKTTADKPQGWVRNQRSIAVQNGRRDSMQAAENGNLSLIQGLRAAMESTLTPNENGSRLMRFMHEGQEFRAVTMPAPMNMILISNAAGPIGHANCTTGACTSQMGSQQTMNALLQYASSKINTIASSNSGLNYVPGPHAAPAAVLARNIEQLTPAGVNGVRTLNFPMNGTMCRAFTHHSSPQSITFISPFGVGSVDVMTGRHNNMGGDASAFEILTAANLQSMRNVAA